MRWLGLLSPLLVIQAYTVATAPATPLFSKANHTIPTLHTSFESLEPYLKDIASGQSQSVGAEISSSTLLVTLATPHFKHLLLNFLCYLHHRLDASNHPPGKYLVATSSTELAEYLSERGVVTLLTGQDDASFKNLRKLDLLLDHSIARGSRDNADEDDDDSFIAWGTLHYQALMLERSLVVSTLVSKLGSSQKSNIHNTNNDVGGVLVVDNDAVWLSSPSSYLNHYYRPGGSNPSFVYASDIEPTSTTSWDHPELPCACFLYGRTGKTLDPATDTFPQTDPADGAALAWRHTMLCHIASTLTSLEEAVDNYSFWTDETSLQAMSAARAPSFQVSSLGPALYLGSHGLLEDVSHEEFMKALNSGNVTDLRNLLTRLDLVGPDAVSCEDRAKGAASRTVDVNSPIVSSEALPYAAFPPGRSFFDSEERELGVEPCVVHANYAIKHFKEQLLRQHGLWALEEVEDQEPQCDLAALERLHTKWRGPADPTVP